MQDLIDYAPYTRIEILYSDDQESEVTWTIQNAAHTGHNGDGKVYVLDVCRAICIQTGELENLAA